MKIYESVVKHDAYKIKYKLIKMSQGQGVIKLLELRLRFSSIFV